MKTVTPASSQPHQCLIGLLEHALRVSADYEEAETTPRDSHSARGKYNQEKESLEAVETRVTRLSRLRGEVYALIDDLIDSSKQLESKIAFLVSRINSKKVKMARLKTAAIQERLRSTNMSPMELSDAVTDIEESSGDY